MAKAAVVETHEPGAGLERATSGPQRLVEFLKETRQEMHKVTTPTREQVQSTTLVVLATVFLFAAYFWLVDVVLGHGIDMLLLHLTKH
jgi:preprotein translocase subunit SecE